MCSWQCGGCGVWYSYSVSSCKCSEYHHILTSTGGSAPHIHQHTQPAILTCDGCDFKDWYGRECIDCTRSPHLIDKHTSKQQAGA